jgi:hypothetical protein
MKVASSLTEAELRRILLGHDKGGIARSAERRTVYFRLQFR